MSQLTFTPYGLEIKIKKERKEKEKKKDKKYLVKKILNREK